ncbi:MAG: hypothetical protein WC595_06835 [Candidatus Nanoarchaeia archaeon]
MDIKDVQVLLSLIDILLSRELSKGFNKELLQLQQELPKLYAKHPELKTFNQRFNKCKKQQEYIVVLSELQEYLFEELTKPPLQSETLTVQEYFPAFITVNQTALEEIKQGIKNERVRKKLRTILENLQDPMFLKKYFHSLHPDSDLFCLKDNITHGVTFRLLYFPEKDTFRFCHFFINHETYQRLLDSRTLWKKNFQKETWLSLHYF